MSPGLTIVLPFSLIGLMAGVAYLQFGRRESRRVLSSVLLMTFALGVFVFAMPANIETKGSSPDETIAVAFCYFAMLLGMMAEYGYKQAEKGEKKFKFDMQFLMPIFASPIVFIPLLTITADMPVGGAFTKSKLMVYLVAFQNGFFWKSFFEERRKQAAEGTTVSPSVAPEAASKPSSRAAGEKP